jgi:CHAT domain-containing protein/tetratricopeptide (TPR) repeat protein
MARRLMCRTNYIKSLGYVSLLLLAPASATSQSAQATGCCNTPIPNTSTYPAVTKSVTSVLPRNALVVDQARQVTPGFQPRPNMVPTAGFLPTPYQTPNPYGRPTREQTIWFVENHPDLKALDAVTKQNLVNGASLPWITASLYLPGGARNPLYGGNWYVPSTWPSSTMNWQGVQRDGSLGNPAINSYNPSYVPTYRPTPPTPARVVNRPPQPTGEKPVQVRIQTTKNQTDRSLDSRPSGIRKAIEDGERALSVHDAAGDKVAQAIDHAELAGLYGQDDQLKQALEHISIAERMAEGIPDPRSGAVFLMRDAAAHMSLGEFEQSIAAYQKAMQILRSFDDEKGQAEVYASIGWAFQSLGKTPDAISSYDKASYLFTKLGDKDGEVRILLGIGSLYQSIGEFDKALRWYTRALPNASQDEQARIQVSVGGMYLSRNEPLDALHHYEAALPLIQSSDNPALEGTILAGMGRCYMSLDSYRLAPETRNFFERARRRMEDAGNRAGEAGVIASIGELDYWIAISSPTVDQKSHFTEAFRSYNEALLLMRDVGDPIGEIGVLTNMGLVFDAWGKYREALGYYRQALRKMEELQTSARIEEFRIDIASQSAGLYQRAILLEVMLNHMEEAFNLSERARARTFLDQLGNRRINARLPQDFVRREERLRQENTSLQRRIGQGLSKPGPEVDQDKILSLESQRSNIQREYSNLISELRVENPEYASFLSISPLTLREAQQQLGPDVTVISYFTTPGVTLAFVLTKDSFHVSKLPVTEAELAWAVATFLDFSGESGVPPSLKLLHKSLIAPVRSQLKTARLAIVPYGILHDVPFSALTPDGKHYLSDDYAVFSLPSLSVLPHIRARNKTSANTAMVFANGQEEGLSYLGHGYDEARDVASFFNTQPILGDAATASAFLKNAGDYDIIHLIAHFDHDKHNSQFARVMLGHGKNDDGALELDQVVGLDLRKTSLVVLSGCQSQTGKLSRGDDIVGLSRAFIYAGSPSVIASLWSVDDEATRALMALFYTHLKQGLSKAEALRASQMDMRQKYPHPYYWAGFVLTGDPGESSNPHLLARSAR